MSELKEDRRIHILMDYENRGIAKIKADSVIIGKDGVNASGNVDAEYTYIIKEKTEKDSVEVVEVIDVVVEDEKETDRKRPIPLWIIIVAACLSSIGIRSLLNMLIGRLR